MNEALRKHRSELVSSLYLDLNRYAFQGRADGDKEKLQASFNKFLVECDASATILSNFKIGDKVTYNGGFGCNPIITKCTIFTVKDIVVKEGEVHLELNLVGPLRHFPQKYFQLLALPKENFSSFDFVYYHGDIEGTIFSHDKIYQISDIENCDVPVMYITEISNDGKIIKGLGNIGKKVLQESFSHKPKVKPVDYKVMNRALLLNKGDFVRYIGNKPETGLSLDEVLQVSIVHNLYQHGALAPTNQNVRVLSKLPRVTPGEYESPWMDGKDFRRLTHEEVVAHNKLGSEPFKKGDTIVYQGSFCSKLIPAHQYKVAKVANDEINNLQILHLRDAKGHWAGKIFSDMCRKV